MPPTFLLQQLSLVRRKLKLFSVLFGLGVVLASAVGLLLLTVLLDYLLNLPAIPRLLLILASIVAVGLGLYRWMLRPALARLSISDVAGRLENAFPQFDDRLRSTVDFLRADLPGSEVMKERVVLEADQMARSAQLDSALQRRPVWYSLSSAGGALVLLLGLGLLLPANVRSIISSRLLTPFHAQAWPRKVQIQLLGDMPSLAPVGEPVNVRLKLVRGDSAARQAIVHYRYGEGPEQEELMIRGEDGTYAVALDAKADAGGREGLLRAWVEAGDDRMDLSEVRVVPRLAIERIEASITPPAYAKIAPTSTDLSSGPALATVGSQIALSLRFNKPLLAGSGVALEPLLADAKAPSAAWKPIDGNTVVGTWSAEQSLRFRVRATDADQFHNTALEEYEILVKPDVSPTVQIENPRGAEQRLAEGYVSLQAVAEDDYGLQSAMLLVDRLGDDKGHWEIPLVQDASAAPGVEWAPVSLSPDRQRFRLNYQWELKDLKDAKLKSGDVLEYSIQVKDNFELPGEPYPGVIAAPDKPGYVIHAPVSSGRLRLTIISPAELERRIVDSLIVASNQIGAIKNDQAQTRTQTEGLHKDTQDKGVLDNADQAALDRLTNQQTTAASQVKQLAGRMEGVQRTMEENRFNPENTELRDIVRDVQTDLTQAAEKPMRDAGQQLNAAKQHKGDPKAGSQEQQQTAQDRNQDLTAAADSQQKAVEQLDKARSRLANLGSLQGAIEAVRQHLEEQGRLGEQLQDLAKANLGKRPEDMKPEDRDKLNKLADQQKNLSDKTQKTLSNIEKMSEQLAKTDPQTSQSMKQAAQTGKTQQVPQKQSQAAQQARQNQQSAAQASQKQAEIGLQMILQELREAEKRKLEELARQLSQLQEQIDNLIRQQAGHNHDNLRLQGDGALKQAGEALIAELIEKSNRKAQVPPADLDVLSRGQIQTERNARDIGKSSEKVQGGAEVAANLTKAADEMERAIVHLRQRQLAEAYEPPQVRALATLEEARQRVAQLKQEVKDKQDEAQREAIRQAYQRIRESQAKLNETTLEMDKLPRATDGQLNRADAIRLAQANLPGAQGKLKEDIDTVGEILAHLDSVVYTWANKEIAGAMGRIKDELAKPNTGAAVQGEQKRVVALLDDMIRNLVQTKRQSEFVQRGGGGGGGGGGAGGQKPRLPQEAELRLLRALQLGVNGDTKGADAQQPKVQPQVVQIGGRQGELRGLLDAMLKKAGAKDGLGPEPDPRDQLPEEAQGEDIEAQELDQQLLNGGEEAKEKSAGDVKPIGDRMARSRQRLALNTDPGKVTQQIQARIVKDLDNLIKQAQQQEAQQQGQGEAAQQQQPDQRNQQADNQGQPKPNAGTEAAKQSTLRGGGSHAARNDQDLRETLAEWGRLTRRDREAVREGATEKPLDKYQKFVEDYYRSLATKATERQE